MALKGIWGKSRSAYLMAEKLLPQMRTIRNSSASRRERFTGKNEEQRTKNKERNEEQ